MKVREELKQLRQLGPAELRQRLAEARQELFNLRFRHATRQLENTAELQKVRRRIARILTVLREKEGVL
ncbi:MAG: 50S ribosomal protein L29 [Chloroflexota bacterium]